MVDNKTFFILMVLLILMLWLCGISNAEESIEEMMKKLCPTKLSKDKGKLICPICPEFTDFAGEDYDRFIVTEVIRGKFLRGKEVKYVGYIGCEPRIRHYGGYVILVNEENGTERVIVDEEREYLGRCKKVSRKDRDLLECRGGDAYQGRPKSWRVLCEIKEDGSLMCKDMRR